MNRNDDMLTEEEFFLVKYRRWQHDMFLVEDAGIDRIEKFIGGFIRSKIFAKKISNRKVYLSNLYFTKVLFKRYNYILKKIYKEKYINLSIIFDIKRKQLYSFLLKNDRLKKVLTNGILLKKLKMPKKSLKKSMTTHTMNIKSFFKEVPNIDYIITIKGLKFELFKIIKLIKKYHLNNSSILILPRNSFYRSQFKKVKAIKRRTMKKYVEALRVKK